MESVKTNEQELTSTMGSLLSTSKEEKNDASDSTPTSSTDAFTTTSTSQIAADDPISSTSSDVLDSKRTDKVIDVLQSSSSSTVTPSPTMSSLRSMTIEDHTSFVSEKDLLVMNITDTSTEKITENVDDIVQDLENLLGEPTTTFDFTIRSKDNKRNVTTISKSEDIAMDIDEFSVEFQMMEEKPKEVKAENAGSQVDNCQNISTEDGNEASQNLNKDDLSASIHEDSFIKSETAFVPEDIKTEHESTQSKCIDSHTSNFTETKTDLIEEDNTKQGSSECVVSTEQDGNIGKDDETSDNVEERTFNFDVSSTDFKEPRIPEQKEHVLEVETCHGSENTQNDLSPEPARIEESPLPVSNESAQDIVGDAVDKLGNDHSEELLSFQTCSDNVLCESGKNQDCLQQPSDLCVSQLTEENKPVSTEIQQQTFDETSETVDVEKRNETKPDEEKFKNVEDSLNQLISENVTELPTDKEVDKRDEQRSLKQEIFGNVTEPPSDEEVDRKVGERSIVASDSQSLDTQPAAEEDKQCIASSQAVATDVPAAIVQESSNVDVSMEVNKTKQNEILSNAESEQVQQQDSLIKESSQNKDILPGSSITEFSSNSVFDMKDNLSVAQNKVITTISDTRENEFLDDAAREENVFEADPSSKTEEVCTLGEITEKCPEKNLNITESLPLNENKADDSLTEPVTFEDPSESQHECCVDDKLLPLESDLGDVPNTERQTPSVEAIDVKDSQSLNLQDTYSENVIKELNDKSISEEQNELELSLIQRNEDIENSELDRTQVHLHDDTGETDPNCKVDNTQIAEENIPSLENSNITDFDENMIIPTNVHSQDRSILNDHANENTEAIMYATNDISNVRQDTLEENLTSSLPNNEENYNADEDTATSPLSTLDTSTNLQDSVNEGNFPIPSSSDDNSKLLEENGIENNMLPLVMEDVPDIDMLNAISTLSDNKSDLIPEMTDNIENNDTLLGSNALSSEEQHHVENVSFEPCIDSALPTVDEIFAEQGDQQSVDLPDDNLETLLAVASLQSVCETDSSYNIAPVDDITSFSSSEHDVKIQDEKIESLFEQKEEDLKVSSVIAEEDTENQQQDTDTGTLTVEDIKDVEEHLEESRQVESAIPNQEDKLKEPLLINVDVVDKEKVYSPKITIKPIKSPVDEEVTSASGECDEKDGSKGSLKMTITKQSDTMHSILKIYDPSDETSQQQENEEVQSEPTVPKLIIKPIVQPSELPHSPKMSTRSSKQVFSPSSSGNQRSASPRITIKPIVKPENMSESVGPVKITIKPVLKPEETHKQKHSPKLTIRPIVKPEEENSSETKLHSPRVTIKPVIKPPEESEQAQSPRITIKPIVKPEVISESIPTTPRVTIKPVVKPQEKEKNTELAEQPVERSSPKITIKPIIKPQEPEVQLEDYEESIKERIVLKINKGTLPGSSKELRKRDIAQEEEKSEKTPRIKLKFSKEGGHPHIVQDGSPIKRVLEQSEHDKAKRQKIETENILPGVTITPIGPSHSKLKEMLSKNSSAGEKTATIEEDDDEVTIVEDPMTNKPSPIVISEESNQDSINVAMDVRDPISEIPVFEITPDSVKTINPQPAPSVAEAPPVPPAPRKRGRPRKVPLQVREDFKDPKEEEPKPVIESTRPKRSCRGQSVRTTLGIKPRKPRGPGRGRGGKRGMGTRSTTTPTPPPETPPPKPAKEPKLSAAKLKPLKEDLLLLSDKTEVKQIEIDDGFHKSPSQPILAPPQTDNSTTDRADIVMYEEETRMSAETTSRAQTPAKQVVSSIPSVDLVEESQSSVQSTATTESVKVRKGPRLEVHQEPEGAVISADQLAEYYWSGGGPYMLQEQVAQFLGIKSFKRKYPNIQRRVVDMQERDFIRESGLAGEAMCDLGLTAVNSSDILDIMYSDFQDKYEEYCKHQRDRQAKDLTNKQKALSLAASQEKTKMDITQQAVQSAASWNANFNKTRKDQRKACMDLQTLTVHFPKGKMKQISKPKVGNYPVALVPGQFTDYYREFTPTEINNLPLNTLCYDPVIKGTAPEMECDSQTDGSGSESESTTSDSDSSYSGSSDAEDCTLCHKAPPKRVAAAQ